jgi:hypothetical protein
MQPPPPSADAPKLDRYALRFVDGEVEERYLDWAFARVIATMTVLNRATVVVMAALIVALVAIDPPLLVPLLVCSLVIVGACVVIDVAFRRRDRRVAMRAAIVGNLTSVGLAALLGYSLSATSGGAFATAVGVFTCQFVTGTARERPAFAIAGGVLTSCSWEPSG